MTERLIEKIDRLANEADIKEVTPEIRRFAMLVRQDVVAQWPKQADVLWASVQEPVEFGMNGKKIMFKVGVQQFTLDYEPDTQDEFNFMREMLIHAFSTFTPCVKTTPPAAQRQWVGLTDDGKEFIELTGGKSDVLLAELVEAKLKEKNT